MDPLLIICNPYNKKTNNVLRHKEKEQFKNKKTHEGNLSATKCGEI